MKIIRSVAEIKKGDTVIVKDNEFFSELGYQTVRGDVFSFDNDSSHFSIKCKETDSIVKISIENGKIFLIS
jgi:hypothetical protein